MPLYPRPASSRLPTTQNFKGAPSGATNYSFTISSGSATVGATYTNNGQTFTVLQTVASGVLLFASGTGTPAASGTLTKSAGTGDATITFSLFNGCYVLPASVSFIEVTVQGGGGGGGIGGTGGGSAGSNGSASSFGTSLFTAGAGGAGGNLGGPGGSGGGTNSVGTANEILILDGEIGEGGDADTIVGVYAKGGNGGNTWFSGCGKGTVNAAGSTAIANSGAGGGGGGGSNAASSAGGGGGGAGGYAQGWLGNPLAYYQVVIGSGGTGATAGTNGFAAGDGAKGRVLVVEYY